MTSRRVKISEAIDRFKVTAMRGVLSGLHYSGIAGLMAPRTRGRGVIFTLHSVDPASPPKFDPNGILRVTPDFLEKAILETRAAGYDIVSLDEASLRMRTAPVPGERPFACFTFDDGYRDNRDHAYPLFKRLGVPMAIYVPPAYIDGNGDLWWLVLEHAIRAAKRVEVEIAGAQLAFDTQNPTVKSYAFRKIYWALRRLPEREMRAKVQEIAAAAGYDASRLCRDLIMTWDEIRALAADPLVTIAAHTVNHMAVAKLPADEARREIAESVARVAAEIGRPCPHFSFPYGDATSAGPRDFEIARALGLVTAVTTHKDVVARETPDLCGLPRISLNGNFQEPRFVRVFLTGAPFALVAAAKRMRAMLRGRGVASAEVRPAADVRASAS
jgi:peptidoglycan/xylan/chitin deacetylase (PgdA/CDA1 family)